MKLSDVESIAAAAESIITVFALLVGGWWSYQLFVRKREKYPRAKTTHSLCSLGRVPGKKLIRVSVKVENAGGVLLMLDKGTVCIYTVQPLPEDWHISALAGKTPPRGDHCEFEWPLVEEFELNWQAGNYRIEPQESEDFHFDVAVEESIQSLQIYSYFRNVTEKKKELGWNCTTIQVLDKETEDGRKASGPVQGHRKRNQAGSSEGRNDQTHNLPGPT